ncbi:ChrR family anti-sigma-E factor [Magnetospirillum molischianum]|uniref:Transcriptional activator ChrR n=1 Tax=Magnetospirillum molischianum DSM 120 TaxID=1150626 RepID=H8FUQ4_MAGML|nr:ChrR family anti-sigma-E factor [Magnetospirillum molischianum]CCG42092.1 Transcriptional activator ChrR [Magnetospirillum molischianum DSM 120]
MSASFHPSDALLAAYAAGAMDEPTALAVATHLAFCPRCRAEVARLEALGGTRLESLPAAPMAEESLASVLARLDRTPPIPRAPARGATSTLPGPIGAYCGGDTSSLPWRRMSPGIDQAILVSCGHAQARLIRMEAGVVSPRHRHAVTEVNVVLQGAYRNEATHYRPGDFAVEDANRLYRPIADSDTACLCLCVGDDPIRPTGLFNRLMAPFMG